MQEMGTLSPLTPDIAEAWVWTTSRALAQAQASAPVLLGDKILCMPGDEDSETFSLGSAVSKAA